MKKLVTVVLLVAVLLVAFVALAFLYIDFSGHWTCKYEVYKDGEPFGSVKVDRFLTEGKVVYKSTSNFTSTLGYPEKSEKLFLNKITLTPTKFTEEATGIKGQKRLKLLIQEGEVSDFLFLEKPEYFSIEDFDSGRKTMVFSPDDIMLYMPIMEKYNYWKKGAQFFEIMIPTEEPMPPLRDKAGVKYIQDDYITIMGNRVEATSFSVEAGSIPTAKIFLSRYGHRVLALEVEKLKLRFILVDVMDNPLTRLKNWTDKYFAIFTFWKIKITQRKVDSDKTDEKPSEESLSKQKDVQSAQKSGEEIFIKSDNLMLSGKMWTPKGEDTFPAVLIVPKDGPVTGGEKYLINFLGDFLSSKGFIVFTYDSPGMGKSQGSFSGLDDEKHVKNIASCIAYIKENKKVREKSISIIGHEGGGYLAVKAAKDLPSVRTCILLGAPKIVIESDRSIEDIKTHLNAAISDEKIGPFDEMFMSHVAKNVKQHTAEVIQSEDKISFFKGVKVPVKEYREFLARPAYETILSYDKPVLLVVSRNDRNFNDKTIEHLKDIFQKEQTGDKVAIFRTLPLYVGSLQRSGGELKFSIEEDLLILITKWVNDNGIYTGKLIQEEASIETEELLPIATPEGVNATTE